MADPIEAFRFPIGIDPGRGELIKERDYPTYISQLVRQVLLTSPGERVNRPDTIADGRLNLLFGFATTRWGEFDAWLVTHHPAASRVRPVSVNRQATSRQRVEWEIETTILKKMDYK